MVVETKDPKATEARSYQQFIEGGWTPGSTGETYERRNPATGAVGVTTPWNFPVLLITWKLAPALAAGCTIVAKPSEFTAGTTFELARIITEAGAPAGVINVVTGPGALVGAELAASDRVDKIA